MKVAINELEEGWSVVLKASGLVYERYRVVRRIRREVHHAKG